MGFAAIAARRALTGLLLLSFTAGSAYAQQTPDPHLAAQEPITEPVAPPSVLELSKAEEIVEVLTTSYAADLALETAVRTAACTRPEPRCAPLFFAQDVILGPWNFVKLLRVMQEQQDPDVSTIAQARDYPTPSLPPSGVLPPDIVSLAEYALEQQIALYEQLEAWQITLERLSSAAGRNDEAATAQRRALDEHSAKASTAAAGVNAAALQFLERLTPLMRHFASAVSVEDAEAAKIDLQEHGFGPELRQRFAALGIGKVNSDTHQRVIMRVGMLGKFGR